jgi:hypothetical protein
MIQPTNTTRYKHVLRPLLAEELAALRESLARDGLLQDLIIDQHGVLLDGYHRLELCPELGIPLRFRQVTVQGDAAHWIRGLQKARRNLDRAEMRKLIAEQVIADPSKSNERIARITGASAPTVASVRSGLVADGKVGDVLRFEANGRLARGPKPANTVPTTINADANLKVLDKNQSEPSPEPDSEEKPEKKQKKRLAPAPVALAEKSGRFLGVLENIVHHCADDDKFWSLPDIIKKLDPKGALALPPSVVLPALRAIATRRGLRTETRPAARGQYHYRIYREEKSIGLSVLKAKFRPVIEDLKKQATLPVSMQSSGRFNAAAAMLIQLLRDLESE